MQKFHNSLKKQHQSCSQPLQLHQETLFRKFLLSQYYQPQTNHSNLSRLIPLRKSLIFYQFSYLPSIFYYIYLKFHNIIISFIQNKIIHYLTIYYICEMKNIVISDENPKDDKILHVPTNSANLMLQALRSDYFQTCYINIPPNYVLKDLKFLMHVSRVLKQDATLVVIGSMLNQISEILTNLGMHFQRLQNNSLHFTKTKKQSQTSDSKLSIGLRKVKLQEEQIDDDQLLKDQQLDLTKQKVESCDTKPRACANCSCGRKDTNTVQVSKQVLIANINEGKSVSGCGKCYLGDSFRCGSCPYKGLPAFKPGDKLQLFEEGKVVVEEGGVSIKTGKVKLQI